MPTIAAENGGRFLFLKAMALRGILIVFLLAYTLLVDAQSGTQNSFSGGVFPGFLLAHTDDLLNIQAHTISVEAQFERDYSNSKWGTFYGHPVTGFGLNYYRFNQKETGHAFTIQSNIRFELLRLGAGSIAFRCGAGIGFLTKRFDIENNIRNQAIGSYFNGFMQTAFLYQLPVKESTFGMGIALSHFSNGAIKVPNLGVNMPSLFFRYAHNVSWMKDNQPKGLDPWNRDSVDKARWEYAVSLIATHKERTMANPQKFNLMGLQLRAVHHPSIKHGWRAGLDLMFDKTYAYVKDIETNLDTIPLFTQAELGLAAGHTWKMGRMQIMGEVGTYLFRPGVYKRKVYERLGFEYHLSQRFGLHTCLKFHRAVADYFEWGIVCRIY